MNLIQGNIYIYTYSQQILIDASDFKPSDKCKINNYKSHGLQYFLHS